MCRNNEIVNIDHYLLLFEPSESDVPFRDERIELGKSNEIEWFAAQFQGTNKTKNRLIQTYNVYLFNFFEHAFQLFTVVVLDGCE